MIDSATRCAWPPHRWKPCGIIVSMKALKSPLAQRVLADPQGKAQLREFLTTKSNATQGPQRVSSPIEIGSGKSTRRLRAEVVPKAA